MASLVTTQLPEEDLIRLVAVEVRSQNIGEADDKATLMLQDLERACSCSSRPQNGRRALLVVDEAQNLPQRSVEELRMLSNFQLRTVEPLLQIFLLGQARVPGNPAVRGASSSCASGSLLLIT